MNIQFQPKDFKTFRSFQEAMAKVFGDTAYIGTNHAVVVVEYSKELAAMLRPFPPSEEYEFVINQVKCGCGLRLELLKPGTVNTHCRACNKPVRILADADNLCARCS
jgi:hypothetical protein